VLQEFGRSCFPSLKDEVSVGHFTRAFKIGAFQIPATKVQEVY
jgi:hypothetical protein